MSQSKNKSLLKSTQSSKNSNYNLPNLSDKELFTKIKDTAREYAIQLSRGKLASGGEVTRLRKDLARLNTEIRRRQLITDSN